MNYGSSYRQQKLYICVDVVLFIYLLDFCETLKHLSWKICFIGHTTRGYEPWRHRKVIQLMTPNIEMQIKQMDVNFPLWLVHCIADCCFYRHVNTFWVPRTQVSWVFVSLTQFSRIFHWYSWPGVKNSKLTTSVSCTVRFDHLSALRFVHNSAEFQWNSMVLVRL